MINKILFITSLLGVASAQSTSADVGVGTIIIIASIIFSILWCLICRSSSRPQIYSLIGILIPILLIVIFIFLPKEIDRPETTTTVDLNFATHIAFLIIAIIGFITTSLFVCVDFFFTDKKAKNIGRTAAFIMKDQQQQVATKRSRAMGSRQGSDPHMRVATNQSNN